MSKTKLRAEELDKLLQDSETSLEELRQIQMGLRKMGSYTCVPPAKTGNRWRRMLMKQAHLENWSIVVRALSPYSAPELHSCCLRGEVYNHPRFEDGEPVITSLIHEVDGDKVITRNTEYTLGKVDPDYEYYYPDAKHRLFSLNKGDKT